MGRKKSKIQKKNKTAAASARSGRTLPNSNSKAKLIFPPAIGINDGITNSASAQFDNEPTSCVRELIQNSLDAAIVEQKEKTANVHFYIDTCKVDKVPGIKEYNNALQSALDHANKNRQSKNAYAPMLQATKENEVAILYVIDNGVGFSNSKLNAMLGDGISDKGNESASGAFGNGHLTSFALSNLQYIFYGGVLESGEIQYTGHASLASHIGKHEGKETVLSKHGFFVKEIIPNKLDERFVFPDGTELPDVPDILRPQIENIMNRWGHGALVAIPAFNFFAEKEQDNADIILREGALNFFIAVQQKKLVVQVKTNSEIKKLTQGLLKQIIENVKEKKRGQNGFPSGNRVWNAYCTLINGEEHTLTTTYGKVVMYLRLNTESQKIALCRNGMWITDKLPKLRQSDFSSKVNFDALLLIDAATSGETHTLFKVAESPLHNKIERRNVKDTVERKKLDQMLEEIRDQIKKLVDDRNTDEFIIDRILPIEVSQSMTGNKIHNPANSRPVSPKPGVRKPGKGKKGSNKESRAARDVQVKVSSRRIEKNKLSVTIRAEENCENAEIRLAVDGGKDVTCAGAINDNIMITGVQSDDIGAESIQELKDGNDKIYAVRLGKWEEGKTYSIEIDYETPKDIKSDYAIIVDLTHRKAVAPTSDEVFTDE